jgi:hypothetical protein
MPTATLPAHAASPDDTGTVFDATHRAIGEPRTMTVEEAALALGISRGLAYEGVRRGASCCPGSSARWRRRLNENPTRRARAKRTG